MSKKMNLGIAGQMNIFSFLANMPTIKETTQEKTALVSPLNYSGRREAILSSADEYLKKGERLTTLAREKYGRIIEALSFSDVEEKLFSVNLSGTDMYKNYVPKIATTVVRPLLKSLTSCDENDESLKILKSLVDYDIDIKKAEPSDNLSAIRVLKRISTNLLEFTLKENEYNPLVVYGLQDNAHPKNRKNCLYKDYSVIGDIAEIIAWLICFTQYDKAIHDESLLPAIEHKVYLNRSVNYADNLFRDFIIYETYRDRNNKMGNFESIQQFYDEHSAPLVVPLQKFRRPSEPSLNVICSMLCVEPAAVSKCRDTFKHARELNNSYLALHDSPYYYVLTSKLDLVFAAIDPINYARTEKGKKLCYHDFLGVLDEQSVGQAHNAELKPTIWPEPGHDCITSGFLHVVGQVLELVFENYKEKVATKNYLEQNKLRAKVWQTKKNIPEKTMKVMQESILNSYFGYVEFDSDVDHDKVSAIVDEFVAFKETYLKRLDTSKVSIRFRKLGNYRAAGMYFPHMGCLCVDFRSPSSFIHEYGHCIDYTLGTNKGLSEESDFFSCYYAYRNAFLKSTAGMKLTGKYDTKYYLRKTEIFARCFEMYVVRTLGMSNSICKPDDETGFAYPCDEKLMARVNDYFGKLFAELGCNNEDIECVA